MLLDSMVLCAEFPPRQSVYVCVCVCVCERERERSEREDTETGTRLVGMFMASPEVLSKPRRLQRRFYVK